MRLEGTPAFPILYLSRRNLLALLVKLDGSPPKSARTLISPSNAFQVTAESDLEHYNHPSREDATPGPMHPATELMMLVQDEPSQ
jgi:hypothetical protein